MNEIKKKSKKKYIIAQIILVFKLLITYLNPEYVFSGGVCIVWYFSWLCLVYEKPSHHTSISDEEYNYLCDAQGSDVIDYVVSDICILLFFYNEVYFYHYIICIESFRSFF